jgi:hypothetical protein
MLMGLSGRRSIAGMGWGYVLNGKTSGQIEKFSYLKQLLIYDYPICDMVVTSQLFS